MAGDWRCWCGECSYRTPWLTEPRSAGQLAQHYAEQHPEAEPGGRAEYRENKREGAGCVAVLAILFLLLVLLATCQYQPGA